jgi:MarR family transcriptional regulator, organic hydroperoxide resistance regulator
MATRGTSSRKPLPVKLANLIEEMMSHIHRRSADDTLAVMNEAGLTMAQMVALHLLTHLGPVSVSSVAACLKLSPPATSHLIDRMVIAGLVGRSEDPIDRRHKRIAITATGRELIEGTNERRTREFTRVLANLTGEAQAQFGRALGRVVTELKELPDRDEVREIVGKELQKREAQAAEVNQSNQMKRNKANRRS